jgi:hypothetical protein
MPSASGGQAQSLLYLIISIIISITIISITIISITISIT